jgi:hypothetical protein
VGGWVDRYLLCIYLLHFYIIKLNYFFNYIFLATQFFVQFNLSKRPFYGLEKKPLIKLDVLKLTFPILSQIDQMLK